jgi:hypothetical protein
VSTKETRGGVWAEQTRPRINFSKSTALEVEKVLAGYFQEGYPVILSSGRGAISVAVKSYWVKNEITVFPYASQCVVNALLSAGISVSTRLDFTSEIIIHQWGILDTGLKSKPFIEDACDTLLSPSGTILNSGGEFEVWSLPKIIGSRFGAVLWCRREEVANAIRSERDKQAKSQIYVKKILRILRGLNNRFYREWEKYEFKVLGLTPYEYASTKHLLIDLENHFCKQRKKYVSYLGTLNSATFKSANLPPGGTLDFDRVPAAVFSMKQFDLPTKFDKMSPTILNRVQFGVKPYPVYVYRYLQENSHGD